MERKKYRDFISRSLMEILLTEHGTIPNWPKVRKKPENVSTSYLALSLSLLSLALNFPVYKEKIGAETSG